jgi:hypothetical protein
MCKPEFVMAKSGLNWGATLANVTLVFWPDMISIVSTVSLGATPSKAAMLLYSTGSKFAPSMKHETLGANCKHE